VADFFQNGVVTTLHKLRDRSIDALESELYRFSQRNAITLVLPSLYSELKGPALPGIIQHLQQVPYISEIVIGLDRATKSEFEHARNFFSALPQPTTILWHEGPEMMRLDALLKQKKLSPRELGKGRNVWFCLGYIFARGKGGVVGLHDCDILTYDRSLTARLFYPVADPSLNFKFCKGYYSRVSGDRLGGRVSRLFFTPLIRALRKILGTLDYLEFMDSFRYPLSGEFSLHTDAINSIRIPSDWGLEVGILSEVYSNFSNNAVCQVDLADRYDHKHQPLSEGNPNLGLAKMSMDIAKSIYRKLATEGITFSNEFFRTIKAAYFRSALELLDRYYYEARLNGLKFDRHIEEQSIEVFLHSVILAGEQFLANPMEVPFIPNWNRIFSAIPEFPELLMSAVETNNPS
jgi:glucosyl-3-phosphoglycerate synthase